jgi:hypothetical protein
MRVSVGVRSAPKEKVDKGFCLDYWRLSYRRKLIRSLWCIPFALLVVPLMPYSSGWARSLYERLGPWAIGALLLAACSIQVGYNYYMWLKTERSS